MKQAYRVLAGCFHWQDSGEMKRLVMEGDVVFSVKPLDTMFRGKFKRVKLALPKAAVEASHLFKPQHPDILVVQRPDKTYLIFDGEAQHGPFTNPTTVGEKLQTLVAERATQQEQHEADRLLLAGRA